MNDIKIIFVDIDWTLLDHSDGHEFDMESINEINRLHDKGIKIFICSARPHHSIDQIGLFNKLKFDGYIACNGGLVVYHDQIVYEDNMNVDLFNKLCEVVMSFDITMEASQAKSRFLIRKENQYVYNLYATYHEDMPPVEDYHDKKVISCLLFAPEEYDEKIIPLIPKELTYYRFSDFGVDIVEHAHLKGDGVRFILDMLNISKENAMAFGDDEGDISMFKEVKYPIAMGNAKDNVKENAFYVTNHVSEHGVKLALDKFINKEE